MKYLLLLAVLFTLLALPSMALAQQPVTCEFEYTVQSGDWLSKIAEKYYGDPLAYDRIFAAANADAADDYTNIDDPNLIEPGWSLCIPGDGNTATGPAAETPLAGTLWLLTSVGGQPVLPEPPVTAKFAADGTLGGSDGCNNYSTGYTVEDGSLTINPMMAATMMACPDPIMQQSAAFTGALAAVASYEISGDQLMLKDADGNTVATFAAQKPAELAGSAWRVIGYNNGKQAVVSVIIGSELTANFGADGNLTGVAGCNNYSAGYTTDGDSISIGPAIATQAFCESPEGVMEQEAQYLAALSTAATYKIELDRLELRTTEGSLVADFERMGSAAEAAVSGTVTYLQRSALPDDAVVNVQVQDTSLADAPATVMGAQIIPANGQQVPIPFEVSYDPGQIIENHTYTLSVRIEDGGGNLMFINTTAVPVITNGNPTSGIEVVVDPV